MASEDEQVAIKRDLAALESRLVERIDDVDTHLSQKIDAIRSGQKNLEEVLESTETRLLTAFEKWAVPVNGRIRKLEVTDSVTEERPAILEERLRALEQRNPDKPSA